MIKKMSACCCALFLFLPALTFAQNARPKWVDDAYSGRPRSEYVAAVGQGKSRQEAEGAALSSLASYFGQSVSAAADAYQRIDKAGSNYTQTGGISSSVSTEARMGNLIGAEIAAFWHDGRGAHYAHAVLDKAAAARQYNLLIADNARNIAALIDLGEDKNSLRGASRYKRAAGFAKVNAEYAHIVEVLGARPQAGLQPAALYAKEAEANVKAITISVVVEGDRGNRLRDAFNKLFAAQGFRTRGTNPAYTLEASVELEQASFPGSADAFCRYTMSAEFYENASGDTLIPFALNDRVGNITYANAENQAYVQLEKRIALDFAQRLTEFLE